MESATHKDSPILGYGTQKFIDNNIIVCTDQNSTAFAEGIVRVYIGPDHREYIVHKSLLEHHSDYFQKALDAKSPWKEAEDRAITLEDIDCKDFEFFASWLYTKQVFPSGAWPETQQFLKLLVFADRFVAPAFGKDVNNQLVNRIRLADGDARVRFPTYEDVIFAFDHLPRTHPILALMVDYRCSYWNPGDHEEEDEEITNQLPKDFLVRVMVRFGDLYNGTVERGLIRCHYHIHDTDEEKTECRKGSG